MHFAILCIDKPDSFELRKATRPAHLEYMKDYAHRALAIGPVLSDDGETMNGSLLIIDFEDRAEAEAFCAGDPYAKAGLFQSVEIRRWKKVLPKD